MALEAVERMIADALVDEDKTGRLANALRERATSHGRSPGDHDLREAVGFVKEYVEQVPAYLRDGLEAARMAGREPEMSEVIREATAYWLTESDIIPDRLGLIGILDDAYYSLTLMQGVSDRHEEESGRASRLNADPMTQMVRALTAMSAHRGAFPIPRTDRIWGDRPTEEIVQARLGRLGLA